MTVFGYWYLASKLGTVKTKKKLTQLYVVVNAVSTDVNNLSQSIFSQPRFVSDDAKYLIQVEAHDEKITFCIRTHTHKFLLVVFLKSFY